MHSDFWPIFDPDAHTLQEQHKPACEIAVGERAQLAGWALAACDCRLSVCAGSRSFRSHRALRLLLRPVHALPVDGVRDMKIAVALAIAFLAALLICFQLWLVLYAALATRWWLQLRYERWRDKRALASFLRKAARS